MRQRRCISAISAHLTDVFMCRADDAKDQLLIQHTVPVTGGMSGSPLVDGSGKVVGIVSGGNTDNFVNEVTVPKGGDQAANTKPSDKNKFEIDKMRIPSAALVNFAQRIDLLEALTAARSIDRRPAELLGAKSPESS